MFVKGKYCGTKEICFIKENNCHLYSKDPGCHSNMLIFSPPVLYEILDSCLFENDFGCMSN